MAPIPHIALFKKHAYKILGVALIFWILIGLLIYATEMIAHHYFGTRALDVIELRQYMLRWMLWLLLTPGIILLALKINVGNCRLPWFVLLHILLGTALLALEFAIEVAVIKPMAEHFYHRSVRVDELMIPFLVKYFAYIINYFLIVGIVNMYIYMQSLQSTQKNLLKTKLQNKELKYQLTLSQLQTLKMQIQPHFLFNAHHSISGLIARKENEKAVQMLSTLSELLRSTLEQQQREFIPLKDEMQTIGLYLAIQQIRFGDRFTYTSNIPEAAGMIAVPYFILQPIVENAMVHGVEQTDEDAILHIEALLENGSLLLTITNTGSLSPVPQHKGMGIGLRNVTERLRRYYGTNASCLLEQGAAGTTTVTIIIPAHE